MRRTLRDALIGLGAALVLLTAWWLSPAPQRRRVVNYWAHGRGWMLPGEHWTQREARERAGLQTLGADALPPLISDLRRPDSWFDRPYSGGPFANLILHFQRSRKPTAELRTEAAVALGLLGPAASNAVPALLDLLEAPVKIGRAPAEKPELAIALLLIGDHSPRFRAALKAMIPAGAPRNQLTAAISLLAFNPDDPEARAVLGSLLDPANSGIIANALAAGHMAARLGPVARPTAMPLRFAILKSYLLWSREALARLAFGLWRADGNPDLALQILNETTTEIGGSDRPEPLLEQRLCSLSEELGVIPAFAAAARPWLERIDPAGPLAESRTRALSALASAEP